MQAVNKVIPIRMSEHEELLGADFFEHDIRHRSKEIDRVWRVREGGQVRSDIISVNLKHGSEL